MPTIYLNQKSGYSAGSITVSDETYGPCKLFKKYKHQFTPTTALGDFICICKGTSPGPSGDVQTCSQEPEQWESGGEKLSLKADGRYQYAELQSVDVYFNQYDLNNPLLFVLNFSKNGESTVDNKYYKMSDFDTDKGGKEISQLKTYSEDSSILDLLISANDTIPNLLTFDIGRTVTSSSGSGSYSQYNNNKIKLTDDSDSDPQVSNGFKKYKHEPLGDGNGKKGCVIYNRDVLLKKNERPIDIQDKKYTFINVYFGDKEKRTNGGTRDSEVPLLIELIKNGLEGAGDPDYYVHKKKHTNGDNPKYYWESLSGDSDSTLKNLLEDIGLYTKSGGRGHGTLKSLLQLASIGNGDGDLSGQLKNATGSTLKSLLGKDVGSSPKKLLVLLLERVEFNLVDSVVILVGKRGFGVSYTGYKESEIGESVGKLEPEREINRLKNEDVEISLNDKTSDKGTCLKKYGYSLWKHDFRTVVQKLNPSEQKTAGLRFLIPAANNSGKYKDLSLYNGSTGPENLVYKYYQKSGSSESKVYVVFYGSDKRPLMLCYGTDTFLPRDKGKYDSVWEKVPGVGKCVCDDTGECKDDSDCCKLLQELVGVVGFLNTVDLSKHPPPTENGTCTNSGSSSSSSEGNACNTAAGQGNTCTYPVHTYKGRDVKVRVTCEAVNGKSCYKKLTHEPVGFNGKSSTKAGYASGFRLGDVVYKGNGCSKKCIIDYYSEKGSENEVKDNGPNKNRSDNWCKPLVSVTAYFYNHDKCYKDPLLVVLEFKKNGDSKVNGKLCEGTKVCEYYKLTERDKDKVKWEIDTSAKDQMSSDKIVKYLDEIRYCIKKVLKVELKWNTPTNYKAMGRPGKSGAGNNGFRPLPNGDKEVEVVECEEVDCTQLNKSHYKCVVHRISTIYGGFDYNQVAGVAFTIPGQGDNPIEIKLYENGTTKPSNCKPGTNGEPSEPIPLFYNSCMGDVYVFFYNGGSTKVQPASIDSVPLMLWYNKSYYKPCNRDSYFTKWVKVSELVSVTKPCGNGDATNLVNTLNEVNKELNRIDLDQSNKATGTSSGGYGLPNEVRSSSGSKVKVDTRAFKTERVALTKQQGPSQPPGNHAYVKVVHRTSNGYTIGEIKYKELDFADKGVIINGGVGGATIGVKQNSGVSNGNHTSLASNNKWNTVVAYYSSNDKQFKLPQLIVILRTVGEVSSTNPVKASEPGYGYYILSSKTSSGDEGVANGVSKDFEYKWVNVTEQKKQVTLNDATDFLLLNSIVILLEKRPNSGGSYNEGKISGAIKSTNLRSPGLEDEINRITGKDKTIKVTTESEGTCLKQYGYKLCRHNFSKLVEIDGSLAGKLSDVTLIAGLRFLIPTSEEGKYNPLKLYDVLSNGKPTGGVIKYHKDKDNKIYVYFYSEDPRPLMLCYDGKSYRALNKGDYFEKWVKENNVTHCKCVCAVGDSDCNMLLDALVYVSNFLNPVKINQTKGEELSKNTYVIHTFKGDKITIKVESKNVDDSFCYNKYTHTHNGTGSDGKGFRLGNIEYNGTCIVEISANNAGGTNKCITSVLDNGNPPKYESSSEVVTYYYKADKDHKNPLLVALCKKGNGSNGVGEVGKCTYQPYYELQKSNGKDTEPKRYRKCNGPITLDDRAGSCLENILNRILFQISKKLQIIIDQRPMERLYCTKPDKNNGQPDNCKKNNNICYKCDSIY